MLKLPVHHEQGVRISDRAARLSRLSNDIFHGRTDASAVGDIGAMQMMVAGAAVTDTVAKLNRLYAETVLARAADLGIEPALYCKVMGAPVISFSSSDDLSMDANALMTTAHGFRACSKCSELFLVNNTSLTAQQQCRDCMKLTERDKKRRQRGTDLSERLCPVCSTSFTPKRSDARCCSGKCRAKLSRQEAKAKQA